MLLCRKKKDLENSSLLKHHSNARALQSTMKFPTFLLYALAFVSVVQSSTDGEVDTDDMVPFYLKRDETNPNGIVAVVFYGELGDTSKEIEVPCTMNSQDRDKYVGPESITCHCMTMRRLYYGCHYSRSSNSQAFANSRCELQVPFSVNRDVNGTIVSVEFDKDDTNSTEDSVLIVPFYPKEDKNGNIVAVMVSNEEQSSSSSTLSPFLIACIAVGSVVVFVVAFLVFQKRSTDGRKNGNVVSSKVVTGTMPPSLAANATPPTQNHDDDTITEASSSVADRI